MCGFFGLVDFSNNIIESDHVEIQKGAESISYRGPDAKGFIARTNLCIAFRRLSIIDLSADSQPYVNETNSVIMVCNGEIYNHQELRKVLISRGHQFKTNTDTEVVLHGYEEWGKTLWNRLNGIFAIVLWDESQRKLYLVRDHLGVKPIHYMSIGSRVYFGSDYNVFFHQTQRKPELNSNALLSYLSFRYVIGEQTFYNGIMDVLPGNAIEFYNGKQERYCYWDIPIEEEEDRGENYYLKLLDEKLFLAVERQLMSDVPLGAFISGGLDSSILLYYMSQNQTDIKSFITGFNIDGYNEFSYADMMAQSLDIQPRKLTLIPEEYMSNIEEVISYRGEPVSIPHEAAFLKMSRLMKKEITVVMSGEGADELFGGYGRIFRSPFDFYKQQKVNSTHNIFQPILKLILRPNTSKTFDSPMDHFLWRYSWFTEEDKRNLLNLDYFDNQYFDEYSLSYLDSLFQRVADKNYYRGMYYIQGKIHLPNLLNRLDRMTMASSVEARVPFLDYELVEFVSRMPIQYKLRWKNSLARLRSIFLDSERISERYDIPKYILKRLSLGKIPDDIIWRKKMGFPVPLDHWFSDGIKHWALELLTDSSAKIRQFVNMENLNKFLSKESFNSAYDYDGKKIWMLINIELWMRKYFN